ncbi:MAG: DUF1449 domain-containing protein [Cyanobacteria bacterium J06641_5]
MWVFNGANFPYWLLMGAGLMLFSTSLFLSGGEEDTDIDGDGDADFGGDADGDGGEFESDSDAAESGHGGSGGFSLGTLLAALGVGKAPLLILLAVDFSLWGFWGWIANTVVASALGRMPSTLLGWGGAVFLGSLLLALFLGSNVARAIGGVMRSFGEDSRADRLIGCTGTVYSAEIAPDRIGQIGAIDPAGNRVTISVRLPEWAQEIPARGSEVTVIDRQPDGYIVIASDGTDRQRWLG